MTALAWVAVAALGGAAACARFLVDGAVATAARRRLPVRDAGGQPERRGGARRAGRGGALRHRATRSSPGAGSAPTPPSRLGCWSRSGPARTATRGCSGRTSPCHWSPGSPRWRSATGSGERYERRAAAAALPLRRARPWPRWRRPLEPAVMEACARRGVRAAVLLRGVTGFGAKHGLRTDRLLTLSEDAPLVAVAVGDAEVVEGLAAEVRGMAAEGLVTLEPVGAGDGDRVRSSPRIGRETANAGDGHRDRVKVAIWGPRSGPGSPHLGAVAALHRCGAEAATVLLGVDGLLGGERRRARFFGANRGVPAITVAIGERRRIEAALTGLDPAPQLVTVEAVVTFCRMETESHHGTARVSRRPMRPGSPSSPRRSRPTTGAPPTWSSSMPCAAKGRLGQRPCAEFGDSAGEGRRVAIGSSRCGATCRSRSRSSTRRGGPKGGASWRSPWPGMTTWSRSRRFPGSWPLSEEEFSRTGRKSALCGSFRPAQRVGGWREMRPRPALP